MYSVADLMRREVATVRATDSLSAAEALWQERDHRHLPVMEGGRVVGLVTPLDALSLTARRDPSRPCTVRDAMSSPVLQVRPSLPLRHAAEMMLKHQIGCVVVTSSSGELVGLLTEEDLVRFTVDLVTDLDRLFDGLRRAEQDVAASA